jgi:hypothetical protein
VWVVVTTAVVVSVPGVRDFRLRPPLPPLDEELAPVAVS